MEHTRDDNSSPHPVDGPATPFLSTTHGGGRDADDPAPSPPPSSTVNSQHSDDKSWFPSLRSLRLKLADLRLKLPQSKPLFQGLERPSFSRIATLTVLCLITYPVFYILTLVAKDKSLFIVRSVVSVWCSGVGFALGYILLKIGAQHLEAATWATVIHMSYEGDGMKLRDLATEAQVTQQALYPPSISSGLVLAIERLPGVRVNHTSFFVVLATISPLLPFLFGRIIEIKTFVSIQRKVYREVLIAGDLTGGDIFLAAARGWIYIPGRTASDTAEFNYDNDTVYFAQPGLSQLIPGGSGAGAFKQPASIGLKDTPNTTLAPTGRNTPKSNTGVVLRYPQWGVRVHCKKLPDPEVNLVPLSNQHNTYVFVPQDLLRDLFGVYGMDLPTELTKPDLSKLDANDTIPSNVDPSKISYVVRSPDNGAGVSLHPGLISDTDQGWTTFETGGWTTIETVLLRLYTGYTPSGRFPIYLNNWGTGFRMGYDAAVCVHRYEPWIIESYNTSITPPSALWIIGKGDSGTLLSPSGKIRGAPIPSTRYLNTTDKDPVFSVIRGNVVYQMGKANDGGGNYVPSPTAESFTDGAGSLGYTELSPDRLAIIRARVSAANALPYLAGSAPVVAQLYADETLAYTTYRQWQLIGLSILVWILGVIGELFVPTLPLNIPRREFGVYSWVALFQSQELRLEAVGDLRRFMSLDELEEEFSDKRVEFAVDKCEIGSPGSPH